MFTGIIEELGGVTSINDVSLTVQATTVIDITETGCSFDVMPETFRRTNLGAVDVGVNVNLERAMLFNGRVGGHLVQGHVDGEGKILSITPEGEAKIVVITAQPNVMKYIVEKGFVAINGTSLTVVEAKDEMFSVSLVKFTYENTDFGVASVGNSVNIEVDILAKYTERLTQGNLDREPEKDLISS
jgi:riboflavin synthase